MKTVLLVGAGSTRAEALSQRASANQKPPLDADFFSVAASHGLVEHRERVQKYLLDHFRIDVDRHPRPGMEEIFGLVYSSTLGNPVPSDADAAFRSLCRIYATVIAETTNWIAPRPKGPLQRLIRALVNAGPLTVVTFNQDILIEKALWELNASKHPVEWYPNDGYAMTFGGLTGPRSTPPAELFQSAPTGTSTSVRVLKPHGSLNWYARTLRQDQVLARLAKGKAVYCTRRQKLETTMQSTVPTKSGKGRKTWYTWPLIVPPIVEKGTFLNAALSPVWQAAWDAMCDAERLVVYGYSLPAADAQTRSFLRRVGAKRPSPPTLVTINPDFHAAERANDVVQPQAHLVVPTVRDYLSLAKDVALEK